MKTIFSYFGSRLFSFAIICSSSPSPAPVRLSPVNQICPDLWRRLLKNTISPLTSVGLPFSTFPRSVTFPASLQRKAMTSRSYSSSFLPKSPPRRPFFSSLISQPRPIVTEERSNSFLRRLTPCPFRKLTVMGSPLLLVSYKTTFTSGGGGGKSSRPITSFLLASTF